MTYIYFYSPLNTNLQDNYIFGRYGLQDGKIVTHSYSDDLQNWDEQTNLRINVPWDLPYADAYEMLDSGTLFKANSIRKFKQLYPELFV